MTKIICLQVHLCAFFCKDASSLIMKGHQIITAGAFEI